MASKYTDESDDNTKLINNYWDKYYSDKDKSVTPYSNALKKPQEGMHVSNAQQQQTITALAEALKDNDDTIIAATDATNSADFVKSYNQYPQAIRTLSASTTFTPTPTATRCSRAISLRQTARSCR